jgi:hypothetical protein
MRYDGGGGGWCKLSSVFIPIIFEPILGRIAYNLAIRRLLSARFFVRYRVMALAIVSLSRLCSSRALWASSSFIGRRMEATVNRLRILVRRFRRFSQI